jgi:hypothetical protein
MLMHPINQTAPCTRSSKIKTIRDATPRRPPRTKPERGGNGIKPEEVTLEKIAFEVAGLLPYYPAITNILKGSVQVRAAEHKNDKSHRQAQAKPASAQPAKSAATEQPKAAATAAGT